jgi:3-hydroxymyristoyl/3-hydroxydecanoyl-(acyl carrier protein) dehydratase
VTTVGDHFAAFSFVDRIRDYTRRGPHARGFFTVPEGLHAFPSCLVAEAVGQLASWVAMDHIDFRGRPVAALALETRFLRDVKPGETLELGVELESCDDEAVSYRGWADVDGARALELIDCLGPMLPLDEFDSPLVLRERFDVLCGAGAPAGRFHGINGFRVEPGTIVPGRSAAATLYVPEAAPFFHDHFPRRPVFPATLLLNEMIQLALNAAGSNGGGTTLVPERMTNVKVRSFTAPGQVLELLAELEVSGGSAIVASLTARAEGRMVATARVDLSRGHTP